MEHVTEPTAVLFGKGFNYSQDGPGNRLVYHFAGCNMHCPWCANPEGMRTKEDLSSLRKAGFSRETVTLSEMEEEILSSTLLFFDGGGVTFTGGECTLQWEFLSEILTFLREKQIHTAIETNATHKNLPLLFDRLSCLIADCKHYDPETLAAVTGVTGDIVLANLRIAAERQMPLAVRIPLIHGFNDRAEDLDGFLRVLVPLAEEDPYMTCELLPYHEYGRDKWTHLSRPYTVTDGFVSPETVKTWYQTMREAGIPMIHT